LSMCKFPALLGEGFANGVTGGKISRLGSSIAPTVHYILMIFCALTKDNSLYKTVRSCYPSLTLGCSGAGVAFAKEAGMAQFWSV
jgi:hypothetical protein